MSYEAVISYFKQITHIPRPSGHEEHIRQRLIWRAEEHWYRHGVDTVGNVVIYIPATPWYENKPTIILQAHMDMVCVKDPSVTHDFMVDPLHLQEQDGRLSAQGTTLWADNWIGIAMILALAEHAEHPPLEVLFTIDEERGLVGALHFDPAWLTGQYLINLDTEDEGDICISCAGGGRVTVSKTFTGSPVTTPTYECLFKNFPWGHSGTDINKNRGNAILAMMECLASCPIYLDLCLLAGGQADNAIPSSCRAIIATSDPIGIEGHIQQFLQEYKRKYDVPNALYNFVPADYGLARINKRIECIMLVLQTPAGVQKMSPLIADLVQTSLNLGMCSMDATSFTASYSVRSSVFDELLELISVQQKFFESNEFEVDITNVYPWRQQAPDAALVKTAAAAYQHITWKEAHIVAYHAGLECGAIVGKLPNNPQAISLGPTITGAHSTHEAVYLPSVETMYKVMEDILKNIQ